MSHNQKITSLFVVNKYGGLIFTKHFENVAVQPNENIYMTQLSSLHSLHLMSQQIAPNPQDYQYMENVVAGDTIICTHQTATGVTFVLVANGANSGASEIYQKDELMRDINDLYVDYVVKNPFYVEEHPFHNNCGEFVRRVTNLIESRNGS